MILESNPFEEPKRSQFLTVLCILSFIMCGLGLLSGIWGIYQSTPEAMQKNVEQVRAVNEEMADQMEDQMIEMQSNSFSKVTPYLGLVYTLASFLGVLIITSMLTGSHPSMFEAVSRFKFSFLLSR